MTGCLQDLPILQARQTLAGPNSPFEGPVTPLSPAWTASQLPSEFLQQLPSIESGIPWTASAIRSSQLTGKSRSHCHVRLNASDSGNFTE